jgi:hypothetical protein
MHHPSLRTLASAVAPVIAALACSLQLSAAHAQQSSTPAQPGTPAQPAAPAQSATPTQSAAPTQSSAPRDIPTPEQLEPGVSTTPSAADAPGGASAPPRSAAEAHAANTAARKEAASGSAGRKGPDRLQLDATEITGNRELPKVLYIVPWKRSDLGDLMGRPVNSLLDEVLQPLDRDVFQRENRYYNGLKPPAAASQGGAGGTPQRPESKP